MHPRVRKVRRSAKTGRAVPMPTGPMVRAIPMPVRKTVKPVRAPTAGWDRHRRRIAATAQPVRKQAIVAANKVRALARRAGDLE